MGRWARVGLTVRWHAGVGCLYAALAIGATWPLARDLSTRIIGAVWFDQRHSIWILWHVKEALLGRQTLFEAELLYYPYGISTLVDGVGPLSGLIALPFWPWGPVAAYNGALLVGFILTAWCMYLLARHASLDRVSAFVAGALFMLWPIHVVAVYGHLEKAFMGLLPLNVLAALLAFDPSKRLRWVIAPAITLLLTLLHNGNQFIFALLALMTVFALRAVALPRRARQAFIGRSVLSAVAAVLVTGPLLAAVARAATDPRLEVALGVHSPHYSPDVLQFVVPSIHQAALGRWVYPDYATTLPDFTRASAIPSLTAIQGWYGSGIETAVTIPLSALILAALAVRYRRSATVPWLVFGLTFAVLSLGPYLRVGGLTTFTRFDTPIVLPYAYLSRVKGFDFMRTPGRFMMLGAVGFALAAGMGVAGVRERWPRYAILTTSVITVVVLIECWPRPWAQQVPLPVSRFYEKLASEPGGHALLDLPSGLPGDYASAYQWYQLTHGKPIAWGYLSRGFREYPISPVREIIENRVADPIQVRQQLVGLGYQYLVWHKYAASLFFDRTPHRIAEGSPTEAWRNGFIRAAFSREPPVFEDSTITVYRLDTSSAVADRPRASVTVDPLAAWTGKQGDADELVKRGLLQADGRGIRWLYGPCRDGNVEVLEWTTDRRISARGWGYSGQRGVVDGVLITDWNGAAPVPLAAVIPTQPRADVAQQVGARADHSGWSLEFTPPDREMHLEFWGLDAKRLEAFPLCSITGDYRVRPLGS